MINPDVVPAALTHPAPVQCRAVPCQAQGWGPCQGPHIPLASCHSSGAGAEPVVVAPLDFMEPDSSDAFLMCWTSHLESWGQFWATHDKTAIEGLECVQGRELELEKGLIPASGI